MLQRGELRSHSRKPQETLSSLLGPTLPLDEQVRDVRDLNFSRSKARRVQDSGSTQLPCAPMGDCERKPTQPQLQQAHPLGQGSTQTEKGWWAARWTASGMWEWCVEAAYLPLPTLPAQQIHSRMFPLGSSERSQTPGAAVLTGFRTTY